MKKFFLTILFLSLILNHVRAQSCDETGRKLFKGNVAIFVNVEGLSFKNGKYYWPDSEEVVRTWLGKVETMLNIAVQQKVYQAGYAIVNRNDEIQEKVRTLVEQNKLEDYLYGISVQARNEGADYILLVNNTFIITEENKICMEYSLNMMNVTNNFSAQKITRTDMCDVKTENSLEKFMSNITEHIFRTTKDFLDTYSMEQYAVGSINGKKATLLAYQAGNGAISKDDKFYVYDIVKNYKLNFEGVECPVLKLNPIATGSSARMEGGNLIVTLDKTIKDKTSALAFRVDRPMFGAATSMTYFGFNVKEKKTFEAIYQDRINRIIRYAISTNPFTYLIEQEFLPVLKAERELQKTEDFLNGHTVEQMKEIGASVLIHVEDFKMEGDEITFILKCINVQSNTIDKSFEIKGNVNNMEEIVFENILSIFLAPCWIDKIEKNEVELYSQFRLSLQDNTPCKLYYLKEQLNPLTGVKSYNRTELCVLKYKEYHGNYHVFKIDKIIDKEAMISIDKMLSNDTKLFLKIERLNDDSIFDFK